MHGRLTASRCAGIAGTAATLVLLAAGCGRPGGMSAGEAEALTGGDARRGRAALRQYGCTACHSVPGIPGADGEVGPPLGGLGRRLYIAGVLPNSPENLVRWIRDPPAVDSLTAMPNLAVSAADARDIAAYLYTLP